MNDDHRQIIIRKIIGYRGNESSHSEYSPTASPVNRWLFYLALIPIAIVVFVLGFFFFSILLALIAMAVIGVATRIWWLRRKLEKAASAQEEVRNVEIEDAEIIETVIHKTNKK